MSNGKLIESLSSDVASGFRCAIEKLPIISGTSVYPVFDFVTSWESVEAVFKAAARTFGYNGTVILKNDENDLLAEAMQTTINADSSRAQQLLGWQPKRQGMVAGMPIYAAAWSANRSSK